MKLEPLNLFLSPLTLILPRFELCCILIGVLILAFVVSSSLSRARCGIVQVETHQILAS